MNCYFLVEGRRTEKKVYPAWLSHLVPSLIRVQNLDEVDNCNYFLFSGEGYPSILNQHLNNSIKDYQNIGKFNLLVVCLDVDDSTLEDRIEEVTYKAVEFGFPQDELRVIPQDCCIETWFLGNRKSVSTSPNISELAKYLDFYNVRNEDPEMMKMPLEFSHRSVFHNRYFRLVSQDKKFPYSKSNPRHVIDQSYLDELIKRNQETNHLKTFQAFLNLCEEIKRYCPS